MGACIMSVGCMGRSISVFTERNKDLREGKEI